MNKFYYRKNLSVNNLHLHAGKHRANVRSKRRPKENICSIYSKGLNCQVYREFLQIFQEKKTFCRKVGEEEGQVVSRQEMLNYNGPPLRSVFRRPFYPQRRWLTAGNLSIWIIVKIMSFGPLYMTSGSGPAFCRLCTDRQSVVKFQRQTVLGSPRWSDENFLRIALVLRQERKTRKTNRDMGRIGAPPSRVWPGCSLSWRSKNPSTINKHLLWRLPTYS